ncbi:sensor domain-containing diguanylate cyclase [Halomonas salipaludis]|uniref:diguanylate cyclase n=1 Tax=Halomonas salipaludis TaxID=2032625 RepID=A0A2A2F2W9_9GAMM|nr:sensor domain-containing diguanylate cyclase [Halomonas salipaludis]PAU79110.1 GGDEF domain-containing protein [Halomonas salipaludis]
MPRILFLLLAACCLILPHSASAATAPPKDLSGWEWRWGDSPLDAAGRPTWRQDNAAEGWQEIGFPSNPPARSGQQHLWLRTTLPDGDWRDPVIYIYSIDLIAQFFLDGELLYQYGEFDDQGRGTFAGWPWHMIELPEGFAGKPLHVRVFSDYTDIGLWGEVKLMDRLDVLSMVVKRSLDDVIISAFSLLLALLAATFAAIGTQRRSLAAVALFSLAAGGMILAETQVSQLMLNQPLLWDGIAANGYFTLPVAMGLLLAHWLEGWPRRWMQRLWQLHLVYLVGALGGILSGLVSVSSTFPPFDLMLAMTLPLMLTLASWRVAHLGTEQRWIIVAFTLMAILLLLDMAVAHGLLGWRQVPVSLGLLAFSLAIVGISLWHYRNTQYQLARLNHQLEAQVKARTAELDLLVQKLEGYSYTDPLTGLKNRRYFDELMQHEATRADREGTPLSLVMIDLDHFKQINDRYGHEAGDSVLATIALLLQEHFRGADVVCRLGGEEFVALLPGATTQQAESRAAELVARARDVNLQHGNVRLPSITLSCGVATYPCHAPHPGELLGLADKALYQAKHQGRDRSTTWSTNAASPEG